MTDRTPGSLELRRQVELSPAERATQRRNRRLLLFIAVPAVVLGTAALIASVLADAGVPAPRPLFVPAGYRAVGDGVFSYAAPVSWSKNTAFSDDTGDLETSGPSGWVGDHLGASAQPPPAGSRPPAAFESFGEGTPTPFAVGPATPLRVSGATVAYEYQVTRPGGYTAVAVNAWQSSTGAELWLMVHADPAVAGTLIQTLRAG